MVVIQLRKHWPREDTQNFLPVQDVLCAHVLACSKDPMLAPVRAGWSGNDVAVLSCLSPPWEACPDHTAPAAAPCWFLYPFRLSPALSPKHEVVGDATCCASLSNPARLQFVLFHRRSQLRDSLLFFYPPEAPRKAADKIKTTLERQLRYRRDITGSRKPLCLEPPTMCFMTYLVSSICDLGFFIGTTLTQREYYSHLEKLELPVFECA